MQKAGVKIRHNVPGDGNCLFHAVCDQLRRLKIARMRHIELRKLAVEHLRNNPTVVNYTIIIQLEECNDFTINRMMEHHQGVI